MKKINCKEPLMNLAGKSIKDGEKDFLIGVALSNVVISNEGNHLDHYKAYEIAKKLYNQSEVELDGADVSALKESIKNSTLYNSLILGQILEKLEQ